MPGVGARRSSREAVSVCEVLALNVEQLLDAVRPSSAPWGDARRGSGGRAPLLGRWSQVVRRRRQRSHSRAARAPGIGRLRECSENDLLPLGDAGRRGSGEWPSVDLLLQHEMLCSRHPSAQQGVGPMWPDCAVAGRGCGAGQSELCAPLAGLALETAAPGSPASLSDPSSTKRVFGRALLKPCRPCVWLRITSSGRAAVGRETQRSQPVLPRAANITCQCSDDDRPLHVQQDGDAPRN